MDLSAYFLWFLLACTCLYILITSASSRGTKPQSFKLPPGPSPLPIVGSLFKLGTKPHESLNQLAKIYGPLMSLKLGSITTVVASSSEMAKEILQKNDQALSSRTVVDAVRALNHHESSMAWLPALQKWRYIRKITNSHAFSTQCIEANQNLRNQKVNDLMDYIHECSMSSGGSATIDIGQVAFTTIFNLISNIMFSIDLANLNSESAHDFKAIVRGVMDEGGRPNFADYFPMLRPIDPQGIRRRMSIHFGKLNKIFDEMIDRRLQLREPRTSNDLLDTLLNLSQQDKSFEFGRPEIKALLTDIFVAGTDTTSSTIEWAMAELLKNPNAMEKARKELEDVVTSKDRKVQESDIAQLPYLQAIVKETFRLHPAVPLLVPHKAESDVNICGFIIPKNAQVLVNLWAIGRDPSIWNNSTSFMPERFLGLDIDFKGQDFELIPFGSGRRICPGLPLAHKMVHFMLASLLQTFDWKLEAGMKPEDLDMQERFGISLQKAEPLRVIPIQASQYLRLI